MKMNIISGEFNSTAKITDYNGDIQECEFIFAIKSVSEIDEILNQNMAGALSAIVIGWVNKTDDKANDFSLEKLAKLAHYPAISNQIIKHYLANITGQVEKN